MNPEVRDERTYAIIGAAMEVHSTLEHGFLEAVYREALAFELESREVPFQKEVPLPIRYKGRSLGTPYRADFICFDQMIVELKALGSITGIEESQVINYLKATGLEIGLLLNFGAPRLQQKRLILSATYLRASASSTDTVES